MAYGGSEMSQDSPGIAKDGLKITQEGTIEMKQDAPKRVPRYVRFASEDARSPAQDARSPVQDCSECARRLILASRRKTLTVLL